MPVVGIATRRRCPSTPTAVDSSSGGAAHGQKREEGWGIAAYYTPTLAIAAAANSAGFDGQRVGVTVDDFTSTDNSAVSVTTLQVTSTDPIIVRATNRNAAFSPTSGARGPTAHGVVIDAAGLASAEQSLDVDVVVP